MYGTVFSFVTPRHNGMQQHLTVDLSVEEARGRMEFEGDVNHEHT